MQHIPDVNAAQESLRPNKSDNTPLFSRYSRAYNITNEDLHSTLRYARLDGKSMLTVAASGDHPLFGTMYGASHIDTFDVTYNAKCIMDIKSAALDTLDYKTYCAMVMDFHNAPDVTAVNGMSKIFPDLDKIEKQYIYKMRGYGIFGMGVQCAEPEKFLPSESEYEKMRAAPHGPFNFIWSDISDLHTHLTQEYDFMHLSNIFHYMEPHDCESVLDNLMPHVAPGGMIMFYDLPFGSMITNCKNRAYAHNKKWAAEYIPGRPIIVMCRSHIR
ncbi:MAG: class I SAM-dependent methyltransferase [Alphaproteobacteria bacterium]|nr:class I SAM-dependent methyltransferase [Alphaproteobacteria bacterium]